ncbi:FlgD immunoglobulin-like domain containing protein [Candidatus Eisenbacteria bacterium]|uniref:FlgD immunoglobulin-like domain containing protein n=1 Tax=Eiseniibacteriota bacterium TaxID=2212470 RepID=A0ABV6YLI0_UNCEI
MNTVGSTMVQLRTLVVLSLCMLILMSGSHALAASGEVLGHQKISDTEGMFAGILDDNDYFGTSVASLGDLDGDGVGDLAVGAHRDDDGGSDRGAVWILFLNPDGTVDRHQKISCTDGAFQGTLDDNDYFGASVASLGDLDGDGVSDLAVGAFLDDDGEVNDQGAVWILFLNANGTVQSHQKISQTDGGFGGDLDPNDQFGSSVSFLGDLDGDGVGDLAVGAYADDNGGVNRGAVWILFLNPNGTVSSYQKISDTVGGFDGVLEDNDYFGNSLASLGDLDGDGVIDLAVGAFDDDDGGTNRGAVWILLLNTNGTVQSHQKISQAYGGFTGVLDDYDRFGSSIALLRDLDGHGANDLAVGARTDGGSGEQGVWVLFLNSDGTVESHQKISETEGGFNGDLDGQDDFGVSAASLGDLNGNGVGDLAVGAWRDDDGASNRGAVWILFLDGIPRGACCFESGVCEYLSETECLDQGGMWQDAGGVCDPNPCPQPGACCFPDGACQLLPQSACGSASGSWQGYGVPCDPNPCTGACFDLLSCECFPVVSDSALSQCTHPGGHYHAQYQFLGEGSSCPIDPNSVEGACCAIGGCIQLTCQECDEIVSGVFHGPNTVCDPDPCPTSQVDETRNLPPAVGLSVPSPSPALTVITFQMELPKDATVNLRLFDITGTVVKTLVDGEQYTAGVHGFSLDPGGQDGRRLPAGIYYLRLEVGGMRQTRRIVLAH